MVGETETVIVLASNETFWLALFGGLYGLTHLAAFTKTPKDDSALAVARKVLDAVAGNYGAARNAKAKVDAVTRMVGG